MQAIPEDFLVPGSDSCKVPVMAEIRNFYDFESFKACRAFVKAIGLTLRNPKFSSDRILAAQMQRAHRFLCFPISPKVSSERATPNSSNSYRFQRDL
jgi:hypothetical protein